MTIIAPSMALPDISGADAPLRARLSRFDRPALSYDELIKAEGTDFVHFAVWTMCNRPVTRSEFEMLLSLLVEGKHQVLLALHAAGGRAPTVPGLAAKVAGLRIRRLPIIGPAAALIQECLGRVVAVVTDKRHRRWVVKRLNGLRVRLGRAVGLSSPAQRQAFLLADRAPPHVPGLSPKAAEIHDKLWRAVHANRT